MYKLFLSFRYLHSRALALLSVVSVGLCVFMVLVAVSLMTGFLQKIESAAKGLFGDIIIEPAGDYGLAYYDEFIAHMKREVPAVRAASPFVFTYGLLRIPGQPKYREPVQVAGIRLPERTEVTDFQKGLFAQSLSAAPTFDPPMEALADRVEAARRRAAEVLEQAEKEVQESGQPDRPGRRDIRNRIATAMALEAEAERRLRMAAPYQQRLRELQERVRQGQRGAMDEREMARLSDELIDLEDSLGVQRPADRAILGLGIDGLSFRVSLGETVRYIVPGHQVVLFVFPLGEGASPQEMAPNSVTLTVVDDHRSGVWSIDSKMVYVPFETLQRLNDMGPQYSADAPSVKVVPERCSQIHVKVADYGGDERKLREVRDDIHDEWVRFQEEYPAAAFTDVHIQTWRQRQADLIAPIASQRVMVVILLGIISFVAVLMIFVVFYIIVDQKTRDIGVLKALGASGQGVMAIFLTYSGAIGLVGTALGCAGGALFVWNVNPIHDWIAETLGLRLFFKETFLFDTIPNTVDPWDVGWIVAVAIAGSVVGAMLPALRAARLHPVEALRYE